MTLADPTPTEETEAEDVSTWMARELVQASRQGHAATGQKIDGMATDIRAYGKLIALLILVLAGLSGLKVVLPDGTSIEPTAEAHEAVTVRDDLDGR